MVKVVALGGGHGLSAALSALRLISDQLTAIVTVADDGGSSGRLRRELGILPPGDLRMALSALCDNTDWGRTWRDVLQHRFTGDGELSGHATGNLLIATLWQRLDDPVAGLDWVARLLGARGRVLPMSLDPLDIQAEVTLPDGSSGVVTGQAAVATTTAHVESVRLIPDDPRPCHEALNAVAEADWVILGPGSWYTSVIPHLLVPDLRHALERTNAKRCLIVNLGVPVAGEAAGMSATELVQAVRAHAPDLRIDAIIVDPASVIDIDHLFDAADSVGASVRLRQVSSGPGSLRHDPMRLAGALHDVFLAVEGDV
ncbi:MAG: uridine diphosphate-N-acetylglucosamine-binding protein YvcK [Actinomycetales bacterium]